VELVEDRKAPAVAPHRLAVDRRGCHSQRRHGLADARIALGPARSRCG
jgi:hypothetical protein